MITDMLLMSSLGVCGRCWRREDDGSESKLGIEEGTGEGDCLREGWLISKAIETLTLQGSWISEILSKAEILWFISKHVPEPASAQNTSQCLPHPSPHSKSHESVLHNAKITRTTLFTQRRWAELTKTSRKHLFAFTHFCPGRCGAKVVRNVN